METTAAQSPPPCKPNNNSKNGSRMLRELRGLMPWAWDARIEDNPVGSRGLSDFGEAVTLLDPTVHSAKRAQSRGKHERSSKKPKAALHTPKTDDGKENIPPNHNDAEASPAPAPFSEIKPKVLVLNAQATPVTTTPAALDLPRPVTAAPTPCTAPREPSQSPPPTVTNAAARCVSVPRDPLPKPRNATPPTVHRGEDVQPRSDAVVSCPLPAVAAERGVTPQSPHGVDTPPLSPPPAAAVADATVVDAPTASNDANATAPAAMDVDPQVEEPVTHENEPVTHEDEPVTHENEPVTHEEEPAEEDLQALEALMQLRDAPPEVAVAPIVAPPPPPHPVKLPYGARARPPLLLHNPPVLPSPRAQLPIAKLDLGVAAGFKGLPPRAPMLELCNLPPPLPPARELPVATRTRAHCAPTARCMPGGQVSSNGFVSTPSFRHACALLRAQDAAQGIYFDHW